MAATILVSVNEVSAQTSRPSPQRKLVKIYFYREPGEILTWRP